MENAVHYLWKKKKKSLIKLGKGRHYRLLKWIIYLNNHLGK